MPPSIRKLTRRIGAVAGDAPHRSKELEVAAP